MITPEHNPMPPGGVEGSSEAAHLAADLRALLAERTAVEAAQSQAPSPAERAEASVEAIDDQEAWRHHPLRLLEHVGTEAVREANEHVDEGMLALLQRYALEGLAQGGLGEFQDLGEANDALGAKLVRLSTIRQLRLADHDRALYVSMVALLNRPAAGETPPEPYQVAMAALRKIDEHGAEQLNRLASRNRAALQPLRALHDYVQAHPEDEAAVAEDERNRQEQMQRTIPFLMLRTSVRFTHGFLAELPQSDVTREQTREALAGLAERVDKQEALQLNWVALPRQPTERPVGGESDDDATTVVGEFQRQRQEQIDDLYALVDAWGEGEVMASQFRGSGDQYLVAVLPQTLPDGEVLRHVVLDNQNYGNARFVWRADRGLLNAEGQPLEFEEVFQEYKPDARALGAKRVVHQGNWRERTLDYLTRKVDELD